MPFRTLVHSELYVQQCAELGDTKRLDDALLLFHAVLASHPEYGRRLGSSETWVLASQNTEPEVVIYYQFNEDHVYLLSIRPRAVRAMRA